LKKPEIIFDSRDEYFKRPIGAITSGTEVTLRLLISRELEPLSVKTVVRYDKHDVPAVYDMTDDRDGSAEADGYTAFSATFNIFDTGLYWYNFEVETEDGKISFPDDGSAWQQTVYKRAYEVPDWICGGIIYHVFVDRFNSSGRERREEEGKILRDDWGAMPEWRDQNMRILNNDFFGGDLEGIRQKLPYLADLNVTCLYLSPIFEAYSNHKYDTGNYEKIDSMFGTEEDFRALCSEAAEHGIRVICDGVFAHTGSDSKYFDKYGHYADRAANSGEEVVPGAYGNPESPYRDWYFFHEGETYDCWWDIDTLPKLNKRNPAYIEYINGENGIVRKWLRAGASGWRLDVADELPNDFLDRLVSAAKAEKSDALIIGEVWEDASNKIAYDERKNYFEGNRLDSVMNYPFRTAVIDFVRKGNAEQLAQTVETITENYPPEVVNCLMNILGTHDSVRILTALAGKDLGADPPRDIQAKTHMSSEELALGIKRLKVASLIQMSLPGVPSIYYGDEVGTSGYKDPFNRTCFPWGNEDGELLNWYRNITKIRTTHDIYKKGSYKTILAEDGLYVFERFESGREPVMTVANCGAGEKTFALEGRWINLLDGQIKEGSIRINPNESLLLERSQRHGLQKRIRTLAGKRDCRREDQGRTSLHSRRRERNRGKIQQDAGLRHSRSSRNHVRRIVRNERVHGSLRDSGTC